MRSWRVLSCVVLACFICSFGCGIASANDISTLDDLPIDPWGELDDIQGSADPEPTEQLPAVELVPYSAWDDSDAWTVDFHGGWSLGPNSVSSSGTGNFTVNVDFADPNEYYQICSRVFSSSQDCIYGRIYNDSYFDVEQSVSYLTSEYESLVVTGDVIFNVRPFGGEVDSGLNLAPDRCRLLINGAVYGSDIDKSGTASYPFNLEIPLSETGSITSIGYRFYYDSARSVGPQDIDEWTTISLRARYDDATLTVVAEKSVPGLLEIVIGWLSSIVDAIVSLPGAIASALGELLQSLFVPSQSDLTGIVSQYQTLFEDRLGFIWQAGDWVVDFGSTVLSALQSGDDYTFQFPGLSVPLGGQTYTILSPTTVSMDNAFMDWARPVAGTAVGFICVVAFVNMCSDMVDAVVSGASYFEFLKRGGRHD